jgi:hypothetical protein
MIITEQKSANIIARAKGYHRATTIIYGGEDRVVSAASCGYRKFTTGEYVSNAYRANFGWKNTYYQHAHCTVMLRVF